MKQQCIILLSFLLIATIMLFLISCDDDSNKYSAFTYYPADQSGPHYSGFFHQKWEDISRDRSADLAVWYPCLEQSTASTGYSENAAPDKTQAPYPLIMFSHGSQGLNMQSIFLMNHLASHGYVVVAPNHPNNTTLDHKQDLFGETALERPVDISFNLDWALSENQNSNSMLYGMIDENYIGVAGHSFGGYTTVVIAGAIPTLSNAVEYCDQNPDQTFCDAVVQIEEMNLGQDTLEFKDDRIKAGFAMAPGGYAMFQDEGVANINIPIMVLVGKQDQLTTYDDEAKPIYEALLVPKYLVEFQPAHHNVFSDFCGILGTPINYCSDAFEAINIYAAAFFGRHLKELNQYDAFLSNEYAQNLNQITISNQNITN
jgi:predicted dienelactone hydrolase